VIALSAVKRSVAFLAAACVTVVSLPAQATRGEGDYGILLAIGVFFLMVNTAQAVLVTLLAHGLLPVGRRLPWSFVRSWVGGLVGLGAWILLFMGTAWVWERVNGEPLLEIWGEPGTTETVLLPASLGACVLSVSLVACLVGRKRRQAEPPTRGPLRRDDEDDVPKST
jgi:hypothetical protein